MVTVVGTVATELAVLVRETAAPLGPAGLVSATVPVIVTLDPPTTVDDDKVTLDKVAAVIVNVAVVDTEPRVAVIVKLVFAETTFVVTVKVAIFAPAATVTETGSVAFVLLDFKLTTVPPAGAIPLRVTVPVDVAPPATDEGESETLAKDKGVIARPAVAETDPHFAVIVDEEAVDTAVVVTVKVALFAPAATDIEVGTVAIELLELSVTTAPPEGATPFKVTVPVDDAPPETDAGLSVTEANVDTVIVRLAVAELEPRLAEIVAEVTAVTPVVDTVNVAEVAPAATVTEAGTDALALLDFSVTTVPPEGAAAERVTVPVLDEPPAKELGLRETELTLDARVMARVDVCDLPAKVAVIVDVVAAVTAKVETVKVAVVAPAATVTVVGTVAAAVLELVSVTTVPPVGAADCIVTVPVLVEPPATDAGDKVSDAIPFSI